MMDNIDQNRIKKGADLFYEGFNCSQSVFAAFAEEGGVEENLALRISGALGGGCAHQGEVCGAVSGGLLALGLFMGRDRTKDKDAKNLTYELGGRFIDSFKKIHGTAICRELLECDLSTPGGEELARERNLFQTKCPQYVETAVEIMDDILREVRNGDT
jgi:C_GCAxxG_C_C family probable redox protein